MIDNITLGRILRRMTEAEKAFEDLHTSLVEARIATESFDATVREKIPAELLAASKASYDVAHHIDRGLDLWENAVE